MEFFFMFVGGFILYVFINFTHSRYIKKNLTQSANRQFHISSDEDYERELFQKLQRLFKNNISSEGFKSVKDSSMILFFIKMTQETVDDEDIFKVINALKLKSSKIYENAKSGYEHYKNGKRSPLGVEMHEEYNVFINDLEEMIESEDVFFSVLYEKIKNQTYTSLVEISRFYPRDRIVIANGYNNSSLINLAADKLLEKGNVESFSSLLKYLKVPELKKICDKFELSKKGLKDDIIERLLDVPESQLKEELASYVNFNDVFTSRLDKARHDELLVLSLYKVIYDDLCMQVKEFTYKVDDLLYKDAA